MPLPKPKKNEKKDDFISRCMGNETMQKEYKDNDQRLAICQDLWEKKESKKTKTEKEVRFINISELRTEPDDNGEIKTLKGHAAVFNKITDLGWFREKIDPGAFAETIKNDDVRALWNHNDNYVLGRSSANTLQLSEDKKGLAVEINVPPTTWAKDLLVSIDRKDIKEMSFGFQTLEESWDYAGNDNETDLRTLHKVRLFDVSPVTFPAYQDTDIALRHYEAWSDDQEMKRMAEEAEKHKDDYKGVLQKYRYRITIAENE